MAENVFEAVKQSVSTREAAEFYGIKVSRTGMACCPFHDDKNPSMIEYNDVCKSEKEIDKPLGAPVK